MNFRSLAIVPLLAALAACTSFNLMQTSRFVNDDGAIVTVEYGSGNEEHVTTFISPVNGKELEMKSKLRVRVTLPDGTCFMAFQCMNFLRSGTLYKTDDERWLFHANGFVVAIYSMAADGRYRPMFNGALCQAPVKPREQRR